MKDKPPKKKTRASSVVVAFMSFQGEVSRQEAREVARTLGAERVEICLVRAKDLGGFELTPVETEGPETQGAPLALVLGDAQGVESGVELVRLLAPPDEIERVGLLIDGHLALAENIEGCVRIEQELKESLRRAQSETRHRSANEMFLARLIRQTVSTRP